VKSTVHIHIMHPASPRQTPARPARASGSVNGATSAAVTPPSDLAQPLSPFHAPFCQPCPALPPGKQGQGNQRLPAQLRLHLRRPAPALLGCGRASAAGAVPRCASNAWGGSGLCRWCRGWEAGRLCRRVGRTGKADGAAARWRCPRLMPAHSMRHSCPRDLSDDALPCPAPTLLTRELCCAVLRCAMMCMLCCTMLPRLLQMGCTRSQRPGSGCWTCCCPSWQAYHGSLCDDDQVASQLSSTRRAWRAPINQQALHGASGMMSSV